MVDARFISDVNTSEKPGRNTESFDRFTVLRSHNDLLMEISCMLGCYCGFITREQGESILTVHFTGNNY